MNKRRIADVFSGAVPVGERVIIEGWIRTRRDSKAGLSFLAVHDGSCFEAMQVVAPAELSNYASDVLRLTSGCAVHVMGEVVASQGKGQTVEIKAETVTVVGWVEDPDTYPMQPKRHSMEYLREVAHLRARTNVIGAGTFTCACPHGYTGATCSQVLPLFCETPQQLSDFTASFSSAITSGGNYLTTAGTFSFFNISLCASPAVSGCLNQNVGGTR